MGVFSGFSDRAVAFYAKLENDNTKQFWVAHKAVYESEVRDPMLALAAELEPEFGAVRLFRPYRDTRFSIDKWPYKTHQGAFAGLSTGIGFYVQIDSNGLLAGGGFRSHSAEQVDRYRKAVHNDATGSELTEIVGRLREAQFLLEGEQLKTRPRGYEANHPRLDLLRYRSLMAVKTFDDPSWLGTPKTVDEVRNAWRSVAPLSRWAITHVGPA